MRGAARKVHAYCAGRVNPEYDQLWEQFSTALDHAERNRQVIEMMKIVSRDMVTMPLSHNVQVVAPIAALQGPDADPLPLRVINWNVFEWEIRA